MDYKDQLVLTGQINNVGDPIMTNVLTSYRAGIEITSGVKICKSLRWDMNMTFSRNKIKNFTEYVDHYDEYWEFISQKSENLGETDLSFSPNFIANSILKYEIFKNLDINFFTKYVSEQYIDNTSNNYRKLNAYLLNNIRIAYSLETDLIKEIGFYLMINNIFSEQYESNAWVYQYYVGDTHNNLFGFYPQAEINFIAGISLKF
ncbi:MAG: TonB-dependent receptor, partial [Bacteroidales bacterium]|nr:TonB-dependent receptor [Bacteroidales bacterium]